MWRNVEGEAAKKPLFFVLLLVSGPHPFYNEKIDSEGKR